MNKVKGVTIVMGASTNETTNNKPWKCTGDLEYGGFHPEIINYKEQCQFCSRHRNELAPIGIKKKKKSLETNNNPPKKSFIKTQILPQLNRFKYGLIALIASAFGLNNETVQTQINSLTNQYLNPSVEEISEVKTSPTPIIVTPTPEKVVEEITEKVVEEIPEEVVEEVKNPPKIITISSNNKEIEIEEGKAIVIDNNLALSPNDRKRNYNMNITETNIVDFVLDPVKKKEDISISIFEYTSGDLKNKIHHSHDGSLREIVLDEGEYEIEVILMGYHTSTYQLEVNNLSDKL